MILTSSVPGLSAGKESRSHGRRLPKSDVIILSWPHKRFFSSLVFDTVASALYQLGTLHVSPVHPPAHHRAEHKSSHVPTVFTRGRAGGVACRCA